MPRPVLAPLAIGALLALSGCLIDAEGPTAPTLSVFNYEAPDGSPSLCTEGLEGIVHFAGMEFKSDLVQPGASWFTGVLDLRYGMQIDIEAVCHQAGGIITSSRAVFQVPRIQVWPGVTISPVYASGVPDTRECPGRENPEAPCISY